MLRVMTEDAPPASTKQQEKAVSGVAPPPDGSQLRFKRYKDLEYSPLFPSVRRSPFLDGTHAGDYGFDPLEFVKSDKDLFDMMEAEVRHCRLAMLCAAGWPMSELKAPDWLLAEGGRAPSVLNGHFFNSPAILATLAAFAAFASLELRAISTPKKETLYGHVHAQDYAEIEDEWPWGVAGDVTFDPLGLYGIVGKDAVGRKVMRDLELSHGRVAMLATLSYVILELATGAPVVDITPFLFANF